MMPKATRVLTITLGLAVGLATYTGCNTSAQQSVNGQPDAANSPVGDDPDAASLASYSFSLRVARHTDQGLSEDRVDGVFSEASRILQNVDLGCADVACPVTFLREGNVDVFDVGSSIVTTERQLDDIFAYPADVKIVTSMVGVCGTFQPGDLAVVLGCASTGGTAVLTHDAPTDVWAHEWGHVQGLPHRDDCSANLMHTYELQTNAVNATERDAFLSPTPGGGLFRIASPRESTASWQWQRAENQPLHEWTEATVSRRYLAGIPSEAFDGSDGAALGTILLDMLAAKPLGHRRLNVIRALGLIGEPDAGAALSALLENQHGVLTDDDVRASAEAFLALGRLADGDETGSVLAYLEQATSPAMWQDRALTLEDGTDATGIFVRFAIMSLGLVENPAAVEHLFALREANRSNRLVSTDTEDQIAEAIARRQNNLATLRTAQRAQRLP